MSRSPPSLAVSDRLLRSQPEQERESSVAALSRAVAQMQSAFKQQLLSMVSKYLDVFAMSDADVGTTNLTFHEIDNGDIRPLR